MPFCATLDTKERVMWQRLWINRYVATGIVIINERLIWARCSSHSFVLLTSATAKPSCDDRGEHLMLQLFPAKQHTG